MQVRHQCFLALALLIAAAVPVGALAPVQIVFGGHLTRTPAPVVPFPRGTLVPLRPVVTALGGHMKWNASRRTATVQYGLHALEVNEAAHALRLDGKPLSGLLAPRRAQGHLLVPLAALERLFGVRGQWQPRQRRLSFSAVTNRREVIGHAASGRIERPAAPPQPAGPASGLHLRLTSDRSSYGVEDPVLLTLTVTNPAQTSVTLQYSSAQHYDFEIRHAGQTIWRWSAGRMFTQALNTLTIGPEAKRVFSQTWNQKDNNGQPVVAGTYEAVATLTTMARPQPQAPPLTFRVGS